MDARRRVASASGARTGRVVNSGTHVGVAQQRRAQRARQAAEERAPAGARAPACAWRARLGLQIAEHGGVQRVEQIGLVAHVVVEAHRLAAEARAEAAHGERLQPLGVDERERFGADARAAEPRRRFTFGRHAYGVSF